MNIQIKNQKVLKGQKIEFYHSFFKKTMTVTTLDDSFTNEDELEEVGVEFENGNKGYLLRDGEDDKWQLGEGDYMEPVLKIKISRSNPYRLESIEKRFNFVNLDKVEWFKMYSLNDHRIVGKVGNSMFVHYDSQFDPFTKYTQDELLGFRFVASPNDLRIVKL